MSTATIETQVSTFFDSVKNTVDAAQNELSLRLMDIYGIGYTAVTPATISAQGTITDINATIGTSMGASVETKKTNLGGAVGTNKLTKTYDGIYANAGVNLLDDSIKSIFAGYISSISNITTLPIIADIDISNFDTAPQWSEAFWTTLKGKFAAFTDNITGADDVDTVVTKLTSDTTKMQVAFYAADRERKQQTLRDAFSAASSVTGAAGFTYPNMMTTALRLASQQTFAFDMSQVSRDLIKLLFDWSKDSLQFSLGKQLESHNADADFNLRYAGVLIEVYAEKVKLELGRFKDEADVVLKKIEAEAKALSSRIELIRANASVSDTGDKAVLAELDLDLKGLGLGLDSAKAGSDYTLQHDMRVIGAATAAADTNFRLHTDALKANIELARTRIAAASSAVSSATQLASTVSTGIVGVVNS